MFIIFIRAPLISNISVLFLFKTIEDWLTIFSWSFPRHPVYSQSKGLHQMEIIELKRSEAYNCWDNGTFTR